MHSLSNINIAINIYQWHNIAMHIVHYKCYEVLICNAL